MEQSLLFKGEKERNKQLIQKLKNKKSAKKRVSKNTIRNQLSGLLDKVENTFTNKDQYKVILDQQELYKYMTKDRIYGLDTESDVVGDNPDPIRDTLVGMSLHSENNSPIYVPIKHQKTHLITFDYVYDYDKQLNYKQIGEVLREVDSQYILHNATYDGRVFLNAVGYFDFKSIIWETYLASRYLNENERKHGLKYLYDRYIDDKDDSESLGFKELFQDVNFSLVPIDIARIYAGKDGLMTHDLGRFQMEYLHPEGKYTEQNDLKDAGHFFINWELPLLEPVAMMEERGFKLDEERVGELKEKYERESDEIEKKIHNFMDKLDFSGLSAKKKKKLGDPINIGSYDQMSIVIFDVMGAKYKERTTDKQALEHFKEITKSKEAEEFFDNILEYRTLNKILDTYINATPEMIYKDGKIRTSLNQYGADTGRFTSKSPNLQNQPKGRKEIRTMFTAENGKILLCTDFSQQEPRILSHVAKDKPMIEAYKNGRDLYSLVASMMFDVPYETCLKGEENQPYRTQTKAILLGIMYGRSTGSVAEQIGKSYWETQKIIDRFYDKFPGVEKTKDGAIEYCKENGYVKTIYGNKRRLPDINLEPYEVYCDDERKKEEYLKKLNKADYKETKRIKNQAQSEGVKIKDNTGFIAEAERQSINSIIQGSASCMTKKAMVLIENDEELKELGYELLLPVHDEVIGQIPAEKELVDKAKKRVAELMLQSGDPVCVPMSVDHELQFRWGGEEKEI